MVTGSADSGILKYFKPASSSSLPDPTGLLRKKVPPKAIEMANVEVEANLNEKPSGGRSSYLILTPTQGHWNMVLPMQYYASKYPKYRLTKTS